MKSISSIFLGMVFLLQALSTSVLLLNYEVNMDYIIENFCENTDRPELKCNGKCHLAKQIQEDSEKKSESPVTQTETTIVLVFQHNEKFEFKFSETEVLPSNSLYLEGNYSNHLQSVFHPPQA